MSLQNLCLSSATATGIASSATQLSSTDLSRDRAALSRAFAASRSASDGVPSEKADGACSPPVVEVRSISKRFGGVRALTDVSLAVARGEIHGLVGENGAGKSTLGKLIQGGFSPDAGELWVSGKQVHFRSPRDALRWGIARIDQELSLVPRMSVLENVFLGIPSSRAGIIRRRALLDKYFALEESTGFGLNPHALAGDLSVAEQQKVAVLRAIARSAQLIIMDEPTAALTRDEAERMLDIVRDLRRRGTTIIYISHILQDVLAVADKVTVLKDGRLVQTTRSAETDAGSLVQAMIARKMDTRFPEKAPPASDAPVMLSVAHLSRTGRFQDISLSIRAGEILGLAGLVGSGRTEVARAIFGADRPDSGEISLAGVPISIRSPRDAITHGIVMIPENRRDDGLHLARPVRENLTLIHIAQLAHGTVIDMRRERREATELATRLDVRATRLSVPVVTLSGGNQQKVLFGKWLFRMPRVLLADEPTRGIDVGAKGAIYQLVHRLAANGMAILLISSELEEVVGLAHRVLVMRQGRVVAEFERDNLTDDKIMGAAFGRGEGGETTNVEK